VGQVDVQLRCGGRHLEVLKWARENDCPWDEETCMGAAWKGHLEVLKWARANGCPWDAKTCETAAFNGRPRDAEVGAREWMSVERESTYLPPFYQRILKSYEANARKLHQVL
jgi:hypothetical protein